MKTFREFLLEEIDTQITTDGGDASFLNPEALQNINSNLAAIGQMKFISPYQGLTKIRKALATYNIFFGNYVFDLEEEDEAVFAIQQFGEKTIEDDDGTVSNDMTVMYLYIMMTRLEDGTFEVDSEIVDEDQLDDILDDDGDLEPMEDEIFYSDVHEEILDEDHETPRNGRPDIDLLHRVATRELKKHPRGSHEHKQLSSHIRALSQTKTKGYTHVDNKEGLAHNKQKGGLDHHDKNLVHPRHRSGEDDYHDDIERNRKYNRNEI